MELAVALELGVYQGPVFLATGGIMSLHTHIHTHKEILEIQTDTSAIGTSNLLVEPIELEYAARLVFIVTDSPDVTRVDEEA